MTAITLDISEGPTERSQPSTNDRPSRKIRCVAPRRPRTRALCTSEEKTEKVALHPLKRNCVMSWANAYEYTIMRAEEYWTDINWEGPREEFKKYNRLRESFNRPGKYSWQGDGHGPYFEGRKVYKGSWPWRETIEKQKGKGGRRRSFQRPSRRFSWHDPRDRSVERDRRVQDRRTPEV